ncbi:hypothetical protein SLE2022_387770 [Rubroshorea leprosula]
MQRDRQSYSQKGVPTFADQVGNNYMHIPVPSASGAVFPPCARPLPPLYGVEFQPSEVCPTNFIIFDQTSHGSQIMFNPAIAQKFSSYGLNFCANYVQHSQEIKDVCDGEKETSSFLQEDSDDIDALLNSEEEEEEEEEEYNEEEVSTARTCGNYGQKSHCSKSRKNSSSSTLRSYDGDSRCNSGIKQQKMKKMVKVLRGIVPGGDQMDTVSVLDEAVRYLKSLKVEAQKLGVGSSKN